MINPVPYKNNQLDNTVEHNFTDTILTVDNFVSHLGADLSAVYFYFVQSCSNCTLLEDKIFL